MLLLLRLLPIDDLFGFNAIPDTARDENIDIHRVEKYFNQTDGMQHWKSSIKKRKGVDVPCLSQAHL